MRIITNHEPYKLGKVDINSAWCYKITIGTHK